MTLPVGLLSSWDSHPIFAKMITMQQAIRDKFHCSAAGVRPRITLLWRFAMGEFIPTTDEMLEKARRDRSFRRKMVSEHLDRLMIAMSRAKERAKTDPAASGNLQEGARLAVKLTEILNSIGAKPTR
jgi:hypothetical protein